MLRSYSRAIDFKVVWEATKALRSNGFYVVIGKMFDCDSEIAALAIYSTQTYVFAGFVRFDQGCQMYEDEKRNVPNVFFVSNKYVQQVREVLSYGEIQENFDFSQFPQSYYPDILDTTLPEVYRFDLAQIFNRILSPEQVRKEYEEYLEEERLKEETKRQIKGNSVEYIEDLGVLKSKHSSRDTKDIKIPKGAIAVEYNTANKRVCKFYFPGDKIPESIGMFRVEGLYQVTTFIQCEDEEDPERIFLYPQDAVSYCDSLSDESGKKCFVRNMLNNNYIYET